MSWRASASLLLGCLMVAPFATAADAAGRFTLEGQASFPDGTTGTVLPRAFFVNDTSGLMTLEARISRGTLFAVEQRFLSIENPGPIEPTVLRETSVRSWPIRDATMTLIAGDHGGMLGIYTAPAATVAFDFEDAPSFESRDVSSVGDPEVAAGSGPEYSGYHQVVKGPHLIASGAGNATYSGVGAIKLEGADVEVRSNNVTRHETGIRRHGLSEVTFTWIYIRFDASSEVSLSRIPLELAAASAQVEWDGVLRFSARDGSLRTSSGTYTPAFSIVTLDGRFEATLTPSKDGQTNMEVSGNVRASSMVYAPVRGVPGVAEGQSWLPLLFAIGVVVVAGAAGGIAVFRRFASRTRSIASSEPPFSAEDCLDAAAAACSDENWPTAARWLERGLKLAPTSARLHADYAFCLSQLGDIEQALTHYGKAHELSQDGESAFNAATAAAVCGMVDEAAAWLVAALDRSPEHVLYVREDEELEPLLSRPEVAQAELWARERLRALGGRFPDDDAEL